MSKSVTYHIKAEAVPRWIAAGVFVVPGVAAAVIGVLTWFGLTWIANPANGILLGTAGTIWTVFGIGIVSFRRWITIDRERLIQGTQTVFRHPAQRVEMSAFSHVTVIEDRVQDSVYYMVALGWDMNHRPRQYAHMETFWLTSVATAEEANQQANRVSEATGLPVHARQG